MARIEHINLYIMVGPVFNIELYVFFCGKKYIVRKMLIQELGVE